MSVASRWAVAALPPSLLAVFARLLALPTSRAPAAWVIRQTAATRVPLFGIEALAARRPDPALAPWGSAEPLVTALAGGDPVEGPLGGAAVVVKDSFDVAGVDTGVGLRDGGAVAERDATLVARIRAAGGRIIGKTKMTELGMDGLGALVHSGMPANPSAPGYLPGGSSTGTAVAVASGLARFGLGGDGLGSVRIPAAFCGLVGLKPTQGRLPSDGYPSPAPSMDVPGPIARSVADCALFWQVLAAEPVRAIEPLVPGKLAWVRQLGPGIACRSIRAAFQRAIAGLGSELVRIEVPGAQHSTALGAAIAASELARCQWASRPLSPAGELNLAIGRSLGANDVRRLEARRSALRDATLRALDQAEWLAMPTTAIPAPAVTRGIVNGGQELPLLLAVGAFTPLANCTGVPAVTVPCGLDDRGRSLAIMLVGRPGSETDLLRVALAIEQLGLAGLRA